MRLASFSKYDSGDNLVWTTTVEYVGGQAVGYRRTDASGSLLRTFTNTFGSDGSRTQLSRFDSSETLDWYRVYEYSSGDLAVMREYDDDGSAIGYHEL